MAKVSFCPIGGIDTILLTSKEMERFANENGCRYVDEVILLPEGNSKREGCNHPDIDECIYWENADTGSHGWACPKCGEVQQWG